MIRYSMGKVPQGGVARAPAEGRGGSQVRRLARRGKHRQAQRGLCVGLLETLPVPALHQVGLEIGVVHPGACVHNAHLDLQSDPCLALPQRVESSVWQGDGPPGPAASGRRSHARTGANRKGRAAKPGGRL